MLKIFKFILKTVLAFFSVLLITWGVVLGLIQIKPVQKKLLEATVAYLERETGSQIEIKGIELIFPLTVKIKELAFIQNQAPLATFKNIQATCTYSALLEGRIIFSLIHAHGIHFQQVPTGFKIDESAEHKTLPFYFKIENLFLDQITFEPSFMNQLHLPSPLDEMMVQSQLSLKGFISNNPFRTGINSHLEIQMDDISHPTLPLKVILHAQRNFLTISLEGKHLPNAISEIFSIDSLFAIEATAPLESWKNVWQNKSKDSSQVEGKFKIAFKSLEKLGFLSSMLNDLTIFEGGYQFNREQGFHLKQMHLKNETFELKGDAVITHDLAFKSCQFSGETKCLNNLHASMANHVQGNFTFQGELKGSLTAPILSIKANSPALKIKNSTFNDIQTSLSIGLAHRVVDGSLNFQLKWEQQPYQGDALFKFDAAQLVFSHLEIASPHSNLHGELHYALRNGVWTGNLQSHLTDLKDFESILPYPLEGETWMNVQLIPAHETYQSAHVTLTGENLHSGEFHAGQFKTNISIEPLLIEGLRFHFVGHTIGKELYRNNEKLSTLTLKSDYHADLLHQDLSNLSLRLYAEGIEWMEGYAQHASAIILSEDPIKKTGQLKFSAHEMTYRTLKVDEFFGETTLLGSETKWPFSFKGVGSWSDKWNADIEGEWNMSQDSFSLRLHDFSGGLGIYPFKLLAPFDFSYQQKEISLSNFSLQLSDAVINADFKKKGEEIHLNFNTSLLPTELFYFVEPHFPLTGKISIVGSLEGEIDQPRGSLQLLLHHTQFANDLFVQKPFMEGEINLDLDDKGIQVKSTIHGIGKTPVNIKGLLPLILRLSPFSYEMNQELPFSLDLQAEGELDPYLHLFYNDISNFSGQTKILLNLSGKLSAPLIHGSVDLYQGSFESLDTGARFHDIEAHLEGEGAKIILTNFIAHDDKKGSISAKGEINLDQKHDFPFEFTITPQEIFIVESDFANISASGPLILSGNRHHSVLKGDLIADTALLQLEQTVPKQIKHVDVVYVNIPENETAPLVLSKKENSFIELDLLFKLGTKALIQGNNLSSEWKGEVTLTGTPGDLLFNGDLRLIKGDYNLNGKVFHLTQGNIHFAGELDKKTSLYIIAGKDIDRIHAEIIVKGPISKPSVSFRSNPPLSQREILSYILFNRGISDITQDQGDQLSQSFIELNDSHQSNRASDFLTRLRNNIGIDRLDITSSDSENKDLSLQVGKYITDSIFISINKNIQDVGNRVAIEANLRKNLKAEAEVEVGGDTQGKVSLKWKKDY